MKKHAVSHLIWKDEFEGPLDGGPSLTHWQYCLGLNNGWGNQELQNYTDKRENSLIVRYPKATGGTALAIRAVKEGKNYTSARLKTQNLFSFQYGRVEARVKLPHGQGIWPAFWMLGANIEEVGWPTCGEIDIMENKGNVSDLSTNHGSLHGPGYSADHCVTATYLLPSGKEFHKDFHLFGIRWEKDLIEFFVDHQSYARCTPENLPKGETWVFNQPFFLLLNLAVGGKWPGYPEKSTLFPQEMLVDYIRVFKKPAKG